MEFGSVSLANPKTAAEQARLIEANGFTHAWYGEVPVVGGGDPYVSMALAALATRTLKLGTYIAAAPLRAAVSIVNSIATVNALAPGRVILGMGSASFTLSLMGRPAMKIRDFREHVRTTRQLLDTGEAQPVDGSGKLRFYNRRHPLEGIALEPRIPLYVAASAPKAAEIAGEYGDGLITATAPDPQALGAVLEQARAAARQAGREVGTLPYLMEGPICVLHAGETLASARAIDIAQPFAMGFFKWQAALRTPVEMVPEPARAGYQDYLAHIERQKVPAAERHLAIWEGVFTARPEERRFVAPDAIRPFMLAGELDEVVERIRGLERAGLTQLVVWPHPATLQWEAGEYLDDVRAVMARVRGRH